MVNNDSSNAKRCVGVLMLNTQFPRFLGDVGNPDSFGGNVLYKTVKDAHIPEVVKSSAISGELLDTFIEAGQDLIDQGAEVLVTSCGFLHAVQEDLSRSLSKPVVTSSLVWLKPLSKQMGEHERLGILTFDSRSLNAEHLLSHDSGTQLDVVGMESREYFYSVIKDNKISADFKRMREDAVAAADALASCKPAAVILECTNLSPYRQDIEAVVQVPVYDLFDALTELT